MQASKDLIEYIAKALVDSPDDVDVCEAIDADTPTLELRVATDDRGKVIGKRGRTVHAMRSLLKAVPGNETSVYLDIVD